MCRVHRHDGGGHREKGDSLSASRHDGAGHHFRAQDERRVIRSYVPDAHRDSNDHPNHDLDENRVIRSYVPDVHPDSNDHPNHDLDENRVTHSYEQFGPRLIRNCAWGAHCSSVHRARGGYWFAIHRVPAAHPDERVRCCHDVTVRNCLDVTVQHHRDAVDWNWGVRHRDAGVRLHEERDCGLRSAMRDALNLVPNCAKRGHDVEPVRALRHKQCESIPPADRKCQ
jgi:hypothetical protein